MITLTDLRKVFTVAGRTVTALDGISLTVPDAAIHGIVGRSGAGKSTLIRCLTGLEQPTAGAVRIGDRTISDLDHADLRAARRRIGMVFQHVNLLDSRTAAGNVAHPLEVVGMPRQERHRRAAELLETVGLQERADSYPAHLSGGERQRVGIARALATEPEVLLFDEPTSALDSVTTRQVLRLIRALRDRLGITIVIITHEMSVVREVCDSVTLLEHGRIVQSGALDEVMRTPSSALARELVPLPPSPVGHTGTLIDVSFSDDVSTAAQVLDLLGGARTQPEIVAGTIETLGGRRVGRLQLDLGQPGPDAVEDALAALRGAGVHAEALR